MTTRKQWMSLAAVCSVLIAGSFAVGQSTKPSKGPADKYRITGPVVELTDTKIVLEVSKDNEKWEFARDPKTKVEGELKVGAKVTVRYRMLATDVEVKK